VPLSHPKELLLDPVSDVLGARRAVGHWGMVARAPSSRRLVARAAKQAESVSRPFA
jgi:hypothetical protein